ncbi:hypothetical protein HJC23_000290 [Cyclotella cryptica]|uniref:Peptidase M1 leukotriene A4 hydrolase/aminopeptidase C-terminal domain-containing protein n=1 Tax=Cyclotella cryptica TaxID=29204 RepID=A0ABD3QID1_9STRA
MAVTLDPSSLSNPHQAILTHLSWEATVDFTSRRFLAKAKYTVKIFSDCDSLRLDTSELDIHSVSVDGTPVAFSLGVPDKSKSHLGSCLEIALPPSLGKTATVLITYATTRNCSATQWLPPQQTAGKKYPYVFTQCQAIHARSLLPCMDCPSVKMTYDACVTVPSWATCVMSALSQTKTSTTDTNTYTFSQPVPIPSYLFALAIGELSSRDISQRCRVWSEPSMVENVAYEFGQVEEFVKVAEGLTMEYQWGRYDILCLPPSFPYGGMENPCLTFVTPTLLAGDRSLADVVAHEAAHSWSGNLVTNETWEHFWLNEGWTIFLQRKIMTKIHGDPKFFDFDAISGWEDLKDSVKEMPDKYTKLIPDLGDGDPDDAFSSVPYEKGFNLLYSLEKLVGADTFAEFTKAYFDEFKFGVINSQKFRSFFEEYFKNNSCVMKFDWDTWLYKPGMPAIPNFDRTLSSACESLADAWLSVNGDATKIPKTDISGWSTSQKICFLDALMSKCTDREQPLPMSTVSMMKTAYSMHETRNAEVLHRFCMISIESGDASIIPVVVRFITTQGRMKFVRPLYRALFLSEMGKDAAVATFLKHRNFYHPVCAKMLAKDLKLDQVQDAKKSTTHFQKHLLIGAMMAATSAIAIALLRSKRR